ncbi:alpha-L-fucosidase [Hanamia caeni]|jgi:alpha-L-fucosidase|uniref:alpha-L-fucosidase n=1 Tax=Hanamia caeni TaxID=2294116 RepID=A0A3M9NJ18_9BACT|nr:alpha-L-fucosidase [Hanamia caeni]RNI37445.1 alpha-L-fucosidase [Hanamia caeni]
MKKLVIYLFTAIIMTNGHAQTYTPTAANFEARQQFENAKFGLFIHWGVFSILGDAEWVMQNENIKVKDYTRLMDFFNPAEFNAHDWVAMAKNAGMKYITLITRHHDGFSMWDTKYSDFNIMNTPYHKDVVKMIVDECHKQDMKIFLYYSLLDWRRDDYSYWTGRTGQGTGRTVHGDWKDYIKFMENQLTELLTNYGKIDGIWFDGYWDQTAPEGAQDRTPRIDWHLPEIYALIHKLQPACLIGNNHHLSPLPGEDFQMFEKDLPGQNKSGLSFQKPSDQLPLETCETMNNSWGFNIKDDNYKPVNTLIHYLVNAAGRNANFLLNVGPQPNGIIQEEFRDTLQQIGKWMEKFGKSIYGTRGNIMPPQDWGVVTSKENKIFVHILKDSIQPVVITGIRNKIKSCTLMGTGEQVKYDQNKNEVTIRLDGIALVEPDTIIEIETK